MMTTVREDILEELEAARKHFDIAKGHLEDSIDLWEVLRHLTVGRDQVNSCICDLEEISAKALSTALETESE